MFIKFHNNLHKILRHLSSRKFIVRSANVVNVNVLSKHTIDCAFIPHANHNRETESEYIFY